MPNNQESKIPIKFTRARVIKNLAVISFQFVLLFTAFDGLALLQSTMNGKNGVGTASQAVIFVLHALSSLILPKYLIKKIGCKMTLALGSGLFVPYLVSNVSPTWLSMIPAAMLAGIGNGVLWAAQGAYFNEAAYIYCRAVENIKRTLSTKSDNNSKSGVGNVDVLVIQHRMKEKIPGLKSKGIIINQEYPGIYLSHSVIESKCSSLEQSLEIKPRALSTIQENHTEVGEQDNINMDNHTVQTARTHLATPSISDISNSIDFKDKLESIKTGKGIRRSVTQQSLSASTSGFGNHFPILSRSSSQLSMAVTENGFGNRTPINISRKQSSSSIFGRLSIVNNSYLEKRASIISQTLKNIVIPERDLEFCTIESITARFFGSFGMLYYTANVWSNLLTYYVLNVTSDDGNVTYATNRSCGTLNCNYEEDADGGSDDISDSNRYLLVGITAALGLASALMVLVFLDSLGTKEDEEKVTFSLEHAMATFNHLKNKEQFLIIPLSMFSGLSQGFYSADFTKSYIQCAWNTSAVGLVSVFYGIAGGTASTASGWVVKYLGRISVVVFGTVLHLGLGVFLLLWHPDEGSPSWMFHLSAAVFGAQVGIIWSQLQACGGLFFKNDQEVAFASYYFCTAVGWTISFSISDYVCVSIKIYMLLTMCCLGLLGYLLADRSFRLRNKL